jgi:hypothetical protein
MKYALLGIKRFSKQAFLRRLVEGANKNSVTKKP